VVEVATVTRATEEVEAEAEAATMIVVEVVAMMIVVAVAVAAVVVMMIGDVNVNAMVTVEVVAAPLLHGSAVEVAARHVVHASRSGTPRGKQLPPKTEEVEAMPLPPARIRVVFAARHVTALQGSRRTTIRTTRRAPKSEACSHQSRCLVRHTTKTRTMTIYLPPRESRRKVEQSCDEFIPTPCTHSCVVWRGNGWFGGGRGDSPPVTGRWVGDGVSPGFSGGRISGGVEGDGPDIGARTARSGCKAWWAHHESGVQWPRCQVINTVTVWSVRAKLAREHVLCARGRGKGKL